ncbi:MAG: GAP family protein [Mycobacteriaceae bacterium]|nr:GAP family protein [Mycobacteriaceae bacterium]
MAGSTSLLVQLLPLALVIALSPLSVIPAVLVLHSPQPRPSGLAFLAGWLASITALTAIFITFSDLITGLHKAPPWVSWFRVAAGTLLIGFGIYQWLNRHSRSHVPFWMRSMTNITTSRAGAIAAALAVGRPEVSLMCATAGLTISSAGLGITDGWLPAAFFVGVSASSVALPVLAYAAAGNRLDDPLTRLKAWMEKHNSAMLAVILVLIGLMVLHNGIDSLLHAGG